MKAKRKYRIYTMLGLVMLGMIIMFANNSIINMLIPTIMEDLKITLADAQWLSSGFVLVCGILVPLSAYLVKRFTYKQLFISSLLIFITGSFVCAFADSFLMLLAGRIIQSIGTGVSMPLALNIITAIFPFEKRGTVMGIYSLGVIFAPAFAPSLGGLLIEYYDWSTLFLWMGILEIIILIGAIFFFNFKNEIYKPYFDFVGFILSSLGFGTFIYGISLNEMEISILGLSLALVSILIIAAFIRRCLRLKENALLNISCFKDYNFSYTLILNVIFTIVMYSGMLLMPMYLQGIRGISPFNAAILLMPGSICMGVLGVFTGRYYDRHGIKSLAIVGSLIMSSVAFMFSQLTIVTPTLYIMAIYLIRSVGIGAVSSPIATAGLITIEREMIPDANALTNTVKQISGAFGASLSVVIMSVVSALSAKSYPSSDLASLHGLNMSFLVMSFISLLGLGLAIFYKKRAPRTK